MNLVVFDIGGTSVKYGLYQDGSIEKKSSFATPKTWDEMKENLYQVFKELSDADTKGVAISSPGAVDTEEGVIKGLSAIPYIHRFKIVDELEALFGLPVASENDANCAGLAESKFGIGQDSKNALYFIIGSGIGGAVCQNGQLYKGSSLFGGEFGYMIIENGKTLSTLASPVQVADRYAKAHGLTDFSGKDLFDLADSGDEEAKALLISSNLGLVRSVIGKFSNIGYERDDLFQLGSIGLIKAIYKFDPSYNVKFSTYAVPMLLSTLSIFTGFSL